MIGLNIMLTLTYIYTYLFFVALLMTIIMMLLLDTVLKPLSAITGDDHDVVRRRLYYCGVYVVLFLSPTLPTAALASNEAFDAQYRIAASAAIACMAIGAATPAALLALSTKWLAAKIENILALNAAGVISDPDVGLYVHIERLLQARVFVILFIGFVTIGIIIAAGLVIGFGHRWLVRPY